MKPEDYLADNLEARWEEMREAFIEQARQIGYAEGFIKGYAEEYIKAYTEAFEKACSEGFAEGRQEVKIEGNRKNLSLRMESGAVHDTAVDRVAKKFGISPDDVRRIVSEDDTAAE